MKLSHGEEPPKYRLWRDATGFGRAEQVVEGRWWVWSIIGRQLLYTSPWAAGIGVFVLVHRWVEEWAMKTLHDPDKDSLWAAAQIVPAIVIAIFVFAVGTFFMVAQVVPQSRGTRAVEVLRGRHIAWTVSPALTLAPGAAFVLVAGPVDGLEVPGALAAALLLGVVVYLVASTACLLDILRDATDPAAFGRLMNRTHESAIKVLSKLNDCAGVAVRQRPKQQVWTRRPGNAQAAVDELYDVARTIRGWARTAATAGDSRELQLALDATLAMVDNYAKNAPVCRLLPTVYWENLDSPKQSSLYPKLATSLKPPNDDRGKTFGAWFPLQLNLSTTVDDGENSRGDKGSAVLARTWLANEVGRSLVRAVEFATTQKSLLDRDRSRLLLAMDKSARLLSKSKPESAGVMVGYLIELGLGARRCPPSEIDWHFDVLATLARLHKYFCAKGRKNLAIGTAAGVVKVVDAIASARVRDFLALNLDPSSSLKAESAAAISASTIADLKNISEFEDFKLFAKKGRRIANAKVTAGLKLAKATWFEPRDLPYILPSDPNTVAKLWVTLGGRC